MLAHLHATPAHALPRVSPRVRTHAQVRSRAPGQLWPRASGCKTASRKNSLLSCLNSRVRCAPAQTVPRETAPFLVASMSGATDYNYFRTYQPNQGRYTQNDPIGLDGGLNRSIYVDANPMSFTDPDGLKGRPSRGRSTASDAAGYHDPRGNLVCEQWTCPSSSSMCMQGDQKRPTDFLPVATTEAPRGCSCTRYAYRPDWRPPNQDISDDWNRTRDLLGDAYNTHRDAKDQAPRFNNGLGRLPHWHRLGGYGK